MSNLILSSVREALEGKFVKWEKVGEVLSIAITMQKPVILFGRGGHGKSEMTKAVFKAIAETSCEYGVQSFGEGMTEAKLYGGLNMKALNCSENPRMEFYPEASFLNKKYYLFEELFDAPPVVLLALKDTITSRQLNNGEQQFPMKTQLLVAATNKQPEEVASLGDTYQALNERFPLQLRVEWDSYTTEDFKELFAIADVGSENGVILGSSLKGLVAQLIADAHAKGEWISPRQAVVALQCVKASAIIAGRKEAKEEDIVGIKFLPGTEGILKNLSADLERVRKVAVAEESMTLLESEVSDIQKKIGYFEKPIGLLRLVKNLKKIEAEVSGLSVPDVLTHRRNKLRENVVKLQNQAQTKALDITV